MVFWIMVLHAVVVEMSITIRGQSAVNQEQNDSLTMMGRAYRATMLHQAEMINAFGLSGGVYGTNSADSRKTFPGQGR
ncbi:MAG: hypothetical protein P1S46_06210 [bacterium]|nr:hypothetical protein [bacterium]